MLLESELVEIIDSQQSRYPAAPDAIRRNLSERLRLDTGMVMIISGIRRCGKSTFIRQLLSDQSIRGTYLNFEDPRLNGFDLQDFEKYDRILSKTSQTDFRIFDEIQNIPGWEKYIRAGQDAGYRYLISGSNASMLSRELGTRLTGRHLSYELFPFSYSEFLEFAGLERGKPSLERYLDQGGFAEYLRFREPDILNHLLDDILYRDISARYGIRHHEQLRQLAIYLVSNSGKPVTYNSLSKLMGFGSPNTVLDYMSFMEQSYLIFQVSRFDYSLRKMLVNPRKIYTIDPGFATVNSLSFSSDQGRKLENTVFLQLRRQFSEIYYFSGNSECDFIVRDPKGRTQAFQVCYELHTDNLQREIAGLAKALEFFKIKEGVIITLDQEDWFTQGDNQITAVPAWRWLG